MSAEKGKKGKYEGVQMIVFYISCASDVALHSIASHPLLLCSELNQKLCKS